MDRERYSELVDMAEQEIVEDLEEYIDDVNFELVRFSSDGSMVNPHFEVNVDLNGSPSRAFYKNMEKEIGTVLYLDSKKLRGNSNKEKRQKHLVKQILLDELTKIIRQES